ncbi:MAG: dTDP-4-dehydrorhamnose reductase [Acidobacteria bacterium]|nr:dTDP-4-dehydrorhamnose reductase [Acidobacteriota bacterium]
MGHRVAIFGSGGQVGAELLKEFQAAGYEAVGIERRQVDITDSSRVEKAVAELDPAVIVNTAAYNMVDVAESEPQAAYAVNGLAVRNLALAARQVDARFVHFSTDYVFDGSAGRPYVESDTPHPLGAYAVSKLAGELYAQAYLAEPLIIRTSGVFGPGALHTNRGNFVELMLRLARSMNPIRVVEDHVGTPTFAPALAMRVVELVRRKTSGIFHIGGGAPITWYEFARKIFAIAGVTPELQATNEREYRTPARRPRYSALRNLRMEELGLPPMPPLDQALRDYLNATGRA